MIITSSNGSEKRKIEKFPYKGKNYDVTNVTIQWLAQAGPLESPEYGLRLFTVGPNGEIPIHKHFYYQTMYILSGGLISYGFHKDTDEVVLEQEVGPDDVVFIPTLEPHRFVNPSDTEPCRFLCCIANVYEEEID